MGDRLRALSLVFGSVLAGSAWGEPPGKYTPEGSGVINGKASVVILPGRFDGVTELLDPAGLEVRLTPTDNPDEELSYPAGSWFQPPPGRYRVWLQGGWHMTPFSSVMSYSGRGTQGGLRAVMPIAEAGRVTLPGDTAPELELHLLHVGSYLEEGFARWEISPRKAAAEVGEGVLMPAGKATAALWDRKSRKFVALSRPFEVRARETVEAPLERPGDMSFLIAQLKRDTLAESATDLQVNLALKIEGTERPPDVAVFTTDRVYAAWYALAPGLVELKGESQQAFLETQQLTLQPGRIERLEAALKPKPALEVQLDLPAALRHDKLGLQVRRLPMGEVLERVALDSATDSRRFEKLPAVLLEVELQSVIGAFSRQVDLTSGKDGFLVLEPDLITVTGTVYLGDEGHPAKLTFANGAREMEARTEVDGRYEMVSLEPLATVSIELDGVELAPYFDFFRPAIAASRQLDFHLPVGDVRVRVLDAVSGKGIFEASVDVRNGYVIEDGASADRNAARDKKERAVYQSSKTDETGLARLPPLRQGTVEIRASAKGYSRMREPLRANILDANSDQTFDILLDPVGETIALRLRLPGGAPAAGAQVLLVDSLATGQSLFSARADGEGLVQAPGKQAGILLVRHPAAAFLVREWRPRVDEGELVWALPPPADRPLIIQVRDSSGTSAVARADLALWVEGRRLSGSLLAWLAGAEPMADANGFWTGRNLPRAPVQILAWGLGAQEEARAGHRDGQAAGVQFPWPDPVEVRAVE